MHEFISRFSELLAPRQELLINHAKGLESCLPLAMVQLLIRSLPQSLDQENCHQGLKEYAGKCDRDEALLERSVLRVVSDNKPTIRPWGPAQLGQTTRFGSRLLRHGKVDAKVAR